MIATSIGISLGRPASIVEVRMQTRSVTDLDNSIADVLEPEPFLACNSPDLETFEVDM